ncbi:hypothetical protein [Niveispirillum irakense]|uniref:hypothetical protein n=1 Tax=Niveispirillum irakense TaxID=34011 RepID=UPI000554AB5E|nr:hypothetical protein [Niveispirillum irakense]
MRLALAAPLSCGLLFLAFAGQVSAGPADVLKCTEIAEASARLACFDRTAPSLRDAPKPPAPPAPPVAAVPPVPPEQRFGAERLEKKDQPAALREEPEAITAVLKEAREGEPNRWVFLLDNGQVWRQVVARGLKGVKPGSKVTVEKAVLGSYSMTIEGVPGLIKVSRVK